MASQGPPAASSDISSSSPAVDVKDREPSTDKVEIKQASKDGGTAKNDSDAPLRLIADLVKSGKAKRIVVLAGAGISTSAGIPDFRSPNTGLYANLAKLKLPYPEAVFDIGFFKKNPKPFWTLAKELYPGKHYPTPTHYFLSLLHKHSYLSTLFTQNIDTLESLTPLPRSKIVEAHGSFATSHCLSCGKSASSEYVLKSGVRNGEVVRCKCGGLVKPDIVFFGEGLPKVFFEKLGDLKTCDLLIIIGTSLQVHPFAGLIDMVPRTVPRILINREAVGPFQHVRPTRGGSGRDHFWQGDADQASGILAKLLGWKGELDAAVEKGTAALRKEWGASESTTDAAKVSKESADELGELLKEALKLDEKDTA